MKKDTLMGLMATVLVVAGGWYAYANRDNTMSEPPADSNWTNPFPSQPTAQTPTIPQPQTVVGYWECLPVKNPNEPHTLECALGIAVDRSDGHFAIDPRLMSQYPVDYPTGTRLRVTGIITPIEALSSIQKYDIDGIIRATQIEEI